jgi:small subunit ribosomal protein S16
MRNRQPRDARVRQQLGTYDPMPNIHNEKLIALNFSKTARWLAHGAVCSKPVEILLGNSVNENLKYTDYICN